MANTLLYCFTMQLVHFSIKAIQTSFANDFTIKNAMKEIEFHNNTSYEVMNHESDFPTQNHKRLSIPLQLQTLHMKNVIIKQML